MLSKHFKTRRVPCEYLGEVRQVTHSVQSLFSPTGSQEFNFLIKEHGTNVVMIMVIIRTVLLKLS